MTNDVQDADGLRRLREEPPWARQVHREHDLARTRATVPEYPQISQAMGKAIASVLYGEADAERGAERGRRHREQRAPGPGALTSG